MAYEPQTFTAGEILTATKMNKIAGNQTSFHDGTGIDDDAITSSKIDFTTIKADMCNMPIKVTQYDSGYFSVGLTRVGNLVIARGFSAVAVNIPNMNGANLWAVPEGYRSTSAVHGYITVTEVYTGSNQALVEVHSDGSTKGYCSGIVGEVGYTGCWVTNDPWPTS